MADKPSRALVLYGDGLARFIDSSHTHLHSLASKASCGFLTLPSSPASETEDERIVRESAILLDACEAYLNSDVNTPKEESQNKSVIPTISERFMGMKAAIITNNSSLKSFGVKFGFSVLQHDELIRSNHPHTAPLETFVASEFLKLLGFHEGNTLDISQSDLVFVHVGAGEKINDDKGVAISSDMEYFNSLVGGVLHGAQPGSEINSRLHLSVVMSYGRVTEDDGDSNLSVLMNKDEKNSKLASLFPHQSCTMKGENPRKDVRHHCPMLIAQWQHAVTRKDMADTFSFKDFKEHGGNLAIPADRFLHEIAFKLWKAPKYGA